MSKVLELLDAMNKGKITNQDVIDILTKSDEKLQDKVATLEAKLAESERNLALCEELRNVEENEYSKDIGKTNSALLRKCEQTTKLIKENKQLKQQLAEKEKEPYLYDEGGDPLSKKDVADLLNRQDNEIKKLENELAKKDELLMKKIGDMKSTDFIKILKRYGYMVQAKEIDNQTAIAELEKVFRDFNNKVDDEFGDNDINYITLDIEDVNFYLQDKIKSLKGEK